METNLEKKLLAKLKKVKPDKWEAGIEWQDLKYNTSWDDLDISVVKYIESNFDIVGDKEHYHNYKLEIRRNKILIDVVYGDGIKDLYQNIEEKIVRENTKKLESSIVNIS